MVSISNLLTGAILLGGISAFMGLGGFKGIGSKLGQGFGDFGTSLISGITAGLPPMAQTTQVKTFDPYPEYLASAGTGDGILEVEKKDGKYCVGGFCFDKNPNLAAAALPRPAESQTAPIIPTTTNSGSLAHSDFAIPSGALTYEDSGFITSSLAGVKITGSGSAKSSTGSSSNNSGSTGGGGGYSSGGSISSGRFSGHGSGGFRG